MRAEGLGEEVSGGLIQRPERIIILALGSYFGEMGLRIVVWSLAVLANFGTAGPTGDITGPNPGDPPDGVVDVFDLLAVLADFGTTCPASFRPQSST